MPNMKIKRALIAVYDKTGIIDFTRALVDEFGIEIISTGGTARHLTEAGIPVTLVEEVTGFPEMLDGRVKTLHPKIHAAILADRDNPEHMRQLAEQGIEPIDMVVVNLYPFEETIKKPDCTFEEAIEMIDIGGPCLLRAAAKNRRHVLVVTTRRGFPYVLECLRAEDGGQSLMAQMVWNAQGVFRAVSSYDKNIHQYMMGHWLAKDQRLSPDGWRDLTEEEVYTLQHRMVLPDLAMPEPLRYGENPHQRAQLAAVFGEEGSLTDPFSAALTPSVDATPPGRHFANDVAVSFNNHVDADAGYKLCKELTRELGRGGATSSGIGHVARVCVFIKHTNACGVGVHHTCAEAYRHAYLGDPNAAMGGILVCNFEVDEEFAETVMATYSRWGKQAGVGGFFVEVWVAPRFQEAALKVIRARKKWGQNVRLLVGRGGFAEPPKEGSFECRWISGSMLLQNRDIVGLNEDQWKVVTERTPTDAEMADLRLAWLVCKHTKSNAITVCKDGMLIGNGAGQMSRVMSCRIATWLAKENGHEGKLAGAVAASDAFFPFRDGPDILANAGVRAIIQPGGSKRDAETIAACNERGLAMIFTGTRHFKH